MQKIGVFREARETDVSKDTAATLDRLALSPNRFSNGEISSKTGVSPF